MTIGSTIEKARERKKLYQDELAKLSGCSQQTIVDIESDNTKKSKHLPEICKALGIDYEALMENPDADLEEVTRKGRSRFKAVIYPEYVQRYLSGSFRPYEAGSDYWPIPENVSNDSFWMVIDNDSTAPVIDFQDIALVEVTPEVKSGDMVCYFSGLGERPVIRKLFIEGGTWHLIRLRDDHRDKFYDSLRHVSEVKEPYSSSSDAFDDIERSNLLLGKVICSVKRF